MMDFLKFALSDFWIFVGLMFLISSAGAFVIEFLQSTYVFIVCLLHGHKISYLVNTEEDDKSDVN